MSLFSLALAGEIRNGRATLRAAAPGSAADLAAALNHAEDCLADLERAEALLESERASAERARAALDRALQLAEIAAEQQRRADEAASWQQTFGAAPDSPAEIKRRAAANKRRIAALRKGGLL